MTLRSSFTATANSESFDRSRIPTIALDDFRQIIIRAVRAGLRVSAMFGQRNGDGADLYAVLADDLNGQLLVGQTHVSADGYPSLTLDCPQVHLFEREIAEQLGIEPIGHPWLKPVRFPAGDEELPLIGIANFYRVEGEEVHEVAVGPVHAGIIEPGHFRFQCHGENVFHLEISLGYQHRGIERAMIGPTNRRALHYMETAAGDTTIGHATAYCQATESLRNGHVSARSQALRGIALELERMANHAGDLGALAGDVGFLPTAAYCGRLRGELLNLTAMICGNRFGRGMVRPGGVGFDVDRLRAAAFLERLSITMKDLTSAVNLLWNSPSVMARFEETGAVSTAVCNQLGLVGPAARACKVARDVRRDHPTGVFCFTHIPLSLCEGGDVFGRAYVRWREIQQSARFVEEQIQAIPAGRTTSPLDRPAGGQFVVSLVEGWRGEICHVAMTDSDGQIEAYKVVDPSFHNWSGLAMALRNQQISDFPLCNKSFNLSYCGHDL